MNFNLLKISFIAIALFHLTNASAQTIVATANYIPSAEEDQICESIDMIVNNDNDVLDHFDCNFVGGNVTSGTNTLSITSDINPLFGATTLDLVLILRSFDTGFESLAHAAAADIDSDGTLSTNDLIKLRKIILAQDNNMDVVVKMIPEEDADNDFQGFSLGSNFSSLDFDGDNVLSGDPVELRLVKVGNVNF